MKVFRGAGDIEASSRSVTPGRNLPVMTAKTDMRNWVTYLRVLDCPGNLESRTHETKPTIAGIAYERNAQPMRNPATTEEAT